MQIGKMTTEAGAKWRARFKLFQVLKIVFASKEIKSFKNNFLTLKLSYCCVTMDQYTDPGSFYICQE